MTFFAALLEAAAMWVQVAVVAARELHVFKSGRTAWYVGLVALFAGDLCVEPGQRVACLGMIEFLRILPVVYVVTARAILPELPFVNVFVAILALCRQAQISF